MWFTTSEKNRVAVKYLAIITIKLESFIVYINTCKPTQTLSYHRLFFVLFICYYYYELRTRRVQREFIHVCNGGRRLDVMISGHLQPIAAISSRKRKALGRVVSVLNFQKAGSKLSVPSRFVLRPGGLGRFRVVCLLNFFTSGNGVPSTAKRTLVSRCAKCVALSARRKYYYYDDTSLTGRSSGVFPPPFLANVYPANVRCKRVLSMTYIVVTTRTILLLLLLSYEGKHAPWTG